MVTVSYHTDPACPWSWAAEPEIRKLMAEFGDGLQWRFVMGGLARDLAPGAAPAAPLPVAVRAGLVEEWLRVSYETQAPLDPLVWSDGPLRTTYPACMAVRAAAEQAADGYAYLRRLREAIMCERRKLDGSEALVDESRRVGLDAERFRLGLRSHAITEAFGADLEATAALAQEAGPPTRASREPGAPRCRHSCSRATGDASSSPGRATTRPSALPRSPAAPSPSAGGRLHVDRP